jgi:hypothetical protein
MFTTLLLAKAQRGKSKEARAIREAGDFMRGKLACSLHSATFGEEITGQLSDVRPLIADL